MNIIGKLRVWLSLVCIFFCVAESKAENEFAFETGKIVTAGIEMPYRSLRVGDSEKPSLVIYLHGGSSKGTDNEKQMKEAGIDSIANYLKSRQMDAIFLVPQCPPDKSWSGPMLGVVKSLIDKHVRDEIVDENKLYIFGGSMGGTGTWGMLSAYPGLFTAAMPVAGNPSKCDADNVATVPLFTVMGTADRIMSVETVSDFINELNARSGITRFEVEEGWSHEMTCIQSYTTQRLDWVFCHLHNPTGIEKAPTTHRALRSTLYYSIDGSPLPEPPVKGLYVMRKVYDDGSVTSHTKVR